MRNAQKMTMRNSIKLERDFLPEEVVRQLIGQIKKIQKDNVRQLS